MFGVGDKVRIVGRTTNVPHKFEIGSIQTIRQIYDDGSGVNCGEWSCSFDEIELVTEGPVREVTRREIVPGTYGRVVVDGASNGTVKLTFNYKTIPPEFTAEELDSAAMVFSQLAEALRDG